MTTTKNDDVETLKEDVRRLGSFIANLDPDSLTARQKADLQVVFRAIGRVGSAGKVMLESRLTG